MEKETLVRLNALKHHLGYMLSRIKVWVTMDWPLVREELLELGENQFDLYTGSLGVGQITGEIGEQLKLLKVGNREALNLWLGPEGYKTLLLSDGSSWVVRESETEGTPAHIHPARYQPLVVRVKSAHLRTAAALLHNLKGEIPPPEKITTTLINAARVDRTGLSPVRSLSECRRIIKVLEFLRACLEHPSSFSEKIVIFTRK